MIGVVFFIFFSTCVVLSYSFYSFRKLKANEEVDKNLLFVSETIHKGALTFLKCLYKYLVFFILLVSLCILFLSSTEKGAKYLDKFGFMYFVFGSLLSMLAGFIGMMISTKSNILTTLGAKCSVKKAFNTSFKSGSLIGMSIIALGLFGLSFIFILNYLCSFKFDIYFATNLILFAFGAECVALFARIGGGIFTKAADIGADLVGKLENDIPEDDQRNPAVIADNVGDNVGDIAGMGSDILGSFVSTVAAVFFMYFSRTSVVSFIPSNYIIIFPLVFSFVGMLVSIIVNSVLLCVKSNNVSLLFSNGLIVVTVINAILAFVFSTSFFPFSFKSVDFISINVFFCLFIGLVVSLLVNYFTVFYTDSKYSPLKYILKQSKVGPSTNVLSGLCIGMESTLLPIFVYSLGIAISYSLLGFYGVSIAAIGVMSTACIHLSIDAFGPIADNAGGLAEMCGIGEDVRSNTDVLDSIGNTTAATGKSFAITSAVFTFFALFSGVLFEFGESCLMNNMFVMVGLILGSSVPYIFSSMIIRNVGNAAMKMVNEVRRQFKDITGLKKGKALPEYNNCILISTVAAINGMLKVGVLVVLCPILLLFIFDLNMSIGFLFGLFLSCILLGLFHSNAGGAWDNVKKSFEKGVIIEGDEYFKGSEPHKSAVVGDTIGDPLKDTSGPSMNIIIKVSAFILVIILPFFIRNFRGFGVSRNLSSYCDVSKTRNVVEKESENREEDVFEDDDFSIFDIFDGQKLINSEPSVDSHSEKVSEPKVYLNKDENGNYEKLTKYDNGYVYESYYKN